MTPDMMTDNLARAQDTIARLTAELTAALELPEVQAMKAALELARNRLQRLAIEFPTESEGRYEVNEWVEEATAALAAIKDQSK